MKETNKKVYQPNNNKVGQSTDDWRIQAARLHWGYHTSLQPFSLTIASVYMFEDNDNYARLCWWLFFWSCHHWQSPPRFRKRRHSKFFQSRRISPRSRFVKLRQSHDRIYSTPLYHYAWRIRTYWSNYYNTSRIRI